MSLEASRYSRVLFLLVQLQLLLAGLAWAQEINLDTDSGIGSSGGGAGAGASANNKELQACVEAFVVHRDKIIRTQDSRDMGAKYLTEFDVQSRFECMRWCCETEHCDVFIFEEKRPGSCYLFHCGPPHDFKCKFTGHANYSSAVLTNSNLQSDAQLEEQIRHTQQEHELKSLRRLESPRRQYGGYAPLEPPVTPSATAATTPRTTSTSTTSLAPLKAPSCNRNQFECRSNDDCIAIYNVCDGIPQCPDASDEAAELGCPADRTTLLPAQQQQQQRVATPKPYDAALPPLLPDMIRYQQMMQQQQQQQPQQHGQYPMAYPANHANAKAALEAWQMSPVNANRPDVNYNNNLRPVVADPMQPQQQQQQMLPHYKQMSYPWNGAAYGGPAYYDPNQSVAIGRKIINGNEPYEPNDGQMHDYPPSGFQQEQRPRIFNHKDPEMRLDELESPSGIYNQDPNRIYAPYYPGVMNGPQGNWQDVNQGGAIAPPATTGPRLQQVALEHQTSQEAKPHQQQQLPATSSTPEPCDVSHFSILPL
uniref:MANSC domain-containing protein n=1 Tax=Trichogramma kaykai TaxID=54128 RepID=A0ABD2X1I2_9HYME